MPESAGPGSRFCLVPSARRCLLPALGHHGHSITTGVLCLVERRVGERKNVGEGGGLTWKGSQPHGDRAVQWRVRWVGSGADRRAGDLSSQLLHDRMGIVSIGLREQYGELVPPE